MARAFANETCSVELYPFEGGPISLQGGQIRSVTVRKSIRGASAGTMEVELAPGGPRGVEDPITWSQVITPMSHMLVGMSRGDDSAIVMDGIVTGAGDAQSWSTTDQNASASRAQGIAGADFGWFFRSFNWFALTFYGLMAGTPVGNALDFIPAGLTNLLNQGLTGGTGPAQVGEVWYDRVMAGDKGILGKTFVPFINGSRVSFTQAVGTLWENYSEAFIPTADYFMTTEGTWADKFQALFPEPWYEFFVTTAPSGFYTPTSGFSGVSGAGTLFNMKSMPYAPAAGPQVVARVNPVPKISAGFASADTAVFGNIDVTRWNGLPLFDYTTQGFGFLSSSVGFSAEGAANFYMLNPTAFKTLFGNNNTNNIPFPFSFVAAADAASVQRYGFRPFIGTTRWMYDPNGTAAQSGKTITNTILSLTTAMVSWAHPRPLMLTGTVTIPLAPNVRVGTRFRYVPFKDGVPWEFYVEGIEHRFIFGGRSSTTLTLSRGLPASIYQDVSADGLLRAIHIGNAMRDGGYYVVGLPDGTGPALQFVTTTEQAQTLNQQLSNIPNTPQAK